MIGAAAAAQVAPQGDSPPTAACLWCLESSKTEEKVKDVRMVGDLVSGHIPIRDKGIVSVSERSVISHGGSASVGVFAMSEELVD